MNLNKEIPTPIAILVIIVIAALTGGAIWQYWLVPRYNLPSIELSEPAVTTDKTEYTGNEKIKARFSPSGKKIYWWRGWGWSVFKFDEANWEPLVTKLNCTKLCENGKVRTIPCFEHPPCREIKEGLSFTWNRIHYVRKNQCGGASGDFFEEKIVEPGKYKVRFIYHLDRDCEREKNVEATFTIK